MDEPEPIAEHDAAELERLVRFMTRKGNRFGLALATHPDPSLAEEVREVARAQASAAGQRVCTVDLTKGGDDVLAHLARESQACDVLFVVGLDAVATDVGGQSRATRAVIDVNLRRDELPLRIDARIVFWIVEEGYPQLARIAWDLISVMLTRFEFRRERERAPIVEVLPPSRPKWMTASPGVDPEQMQLQAESLARAAGSAHDDSTISDAAASAGQLFARVGRLDEANKWLKVAVHAYERLGERRRDPHLILAAATQQRRLAEIQQLQGESEGASNGASRSLALVDRAEQLANKGGDPWREADRERIQSLAVLASLQPEPPRDGDVDGWDLLLRWRAGDGRAGSRLIKRYFGVVRRYFVHRTGESEDLVQETFSRMLQSTAPQSPTSFRSFLMSFARHVFHEYVRRRVDTRFIEFDELDFSDWVDPAPPSDGIMEEQVMPSIVLGALRQLSSEDQDLLEFYYFEQLDFDELSQVFDVPEGTLRARLASARKRLANAYTGSTQHPTEPHVERMLESLRSRGA